MLNKNLNIPLLLISIVFVLINEIDGHGMMLDPVSRSSRWRYNNSAPINYDDNGLNCGGYGNQWSKNHGRCGLCGDNFAAPSPRPNELGGKYGQGVITKVYTQSQIAHLEIEITANHLGYFYFDICNLDKFKTESQHCFRANKLHFSDKSLRMYIGEQSGMIYPSIVLPKDLNCKHCVLRWNYRASYNWGNCGNGTFAKGCGPQENFKGCSDISIKRQIHSSRTAEAESSKENDFDNIRLEFENEEMAVPVFDKEHNNDIDNYPYKSEEEDDVPMEAFL